MTCSHGRNRNWRLSHPFFRIILSSHNKKTNNQTNNKFNWGIDFQCFFLPHHCYVKQLKSLFIYIRNVFLLLFNCHYFIHDYFVYNIIFNYFNIILLLFILIIFILLYLLLRYLICN